MHIAKVKSTIIDYLIQANHQLHYISRKNKLCNALIYGTIS